MFRDPRQHDDKHLAAIRELPCVVCGNDIETEAAHVRYSDSRLGKRYCGKAEKPHDWWTVPLCGKCHRGQHSYPNGEREWWQHYAGKDPLPVALALYLAPDHETRLQIVLANR